MFILNLLRAEGSIADKLIVALAFILVATFSIVVHEVSHGYVAKLNGDLTAKERGRLTLNPAAHLDPIGVFMMLLVGFGWAKPVPVNTSNFTNRKKGIFTVSIAGVSANLIVASVGLLLYFLLYPVIIKGMYAAGSNAIVNVLLNFVYALLVLSIRINFLLAFFNLLPIYPLDGFNIVNSFLPIGNGYQRFMVKYGSFLLIGLIIIGNVGDMLNFEWLNIFNLFGNLISDMIDKVTLQSLITFFK